MSAIHDDGAFGAAAVAVAMGSSASQSKEYGTISYVAAKDALTLAVSELVVVCNCFSGVPKQPS